VLLIISIFERASVGEPVDISVGEPDGKFVGKLPISINFLRNFKKAAKKIESDLFEDKIKNEMQKIPLE